MGNRKNNLTWKWPLISLEWIPEILSSFGNLIEPSWIALQREMTIHVTNKSFANHLFAQLRSVLSETRLVQEDNRFIKSTVPSHYNHIRLHLIKFMNDSVSPWSNYFRSIWKQECELNFDDIKGQPPIQWPDISSYPIFKQWCEFFQYIGYGFLIRNDHFIPESCITKDMIQDKKFIEKSIKTTGDPRHLTGVFSLHTKADCLTWTKGEDILPLSGDSNLVPRIACEKIVQRWEKNNNIPGAWRLSLLESKDEWYQSIDKLLYEYPFSDLKKVIYTCKHLLDYFLFGRSVFDDDFIDREQIYSIQKRWKTIKFFIMSEQIWKIIPNLYKDVTRLYWGISNFRDSLQRPNYSQDLFDETVFQNHGEIAPKSLTIRCGRSKRTLQALLKTFSILHKSLSKLMNKNMGDYYYAKVNTEYSNITNYLPSNPLHISEIIDELEMLINIDTEEKIQLLNMPQPIYTDIGIPDNPLLKLCFWVHKHCECNEIPYFKTVRNIKKRLKSLEENLVKEISYYESDLDEWKEACNRLKEKVNSLRPT